MKTSNLQVASWQSCLTGLRLWDTNPELCLRTFSKLHAAHVEPQRVYHTATHINACLDWVNAIEDKLAQPDWVRLALYFHDAVYHPNVNDNEAQSAAWAVEFLQELCAHDDMIDWVESAILATKVHSKHADKDTAYLLDIDMSILGQTAKAYNVYTQAIREEYACVSDTDYLVGRTQVLLHFLGSATLYQTAYFRVRLETQAVNNILNELMSLTA